MERLKVLLIGVTVSALSLIPLTSHAEISDCLSIDEDLKRLACYDHETNYQKDLAPTNDTGAWNVQVETSKIDDSTNVFLFLGSFEQSNCPYKSGSHTLVIACRENTTSLYVTFARCFMSDIQGKGRVTYRIDKDSAEKIRMHESNNNMALGLWNGGTSISFIKKMFGHDYLLLRATPFSDSTITGEYHISGIEEAIKPLRTACHW